MRAPSENAGILLEWYRAMGVDETIADETRDWLSEIPRAEQPLPKGIDVDANVNRKPPSRERADLTHLAATARAAPAELPASNDVMAARELARSAKSLEELRGLLESFEGCGLKATASRLCLSRGSPSAPLMLIGEAPGKDEDRQGQPFVGRAGQLLDRMLAAIGLTEADFYITNIVFWRPPGNRTPSPEEVQVCQPFVERQIELLAPKIVVFLGNAAAKQLTGATEGIMKLRGKWLELPGHPGARAMATLHPAYLLRTPIAKRLAWRDLLAVREALDTLEGRP
ncbi:uracil-DNA glycosylase [Rhodomicrobium udaipurense]|uniref:Type-4 uracil-DNA glycosylase n=2 Tax=Rhodomicrobium udaipurense TaxID=1202716 RepID=A0A8I1KI83_9HYPH|nr:uracil-DNA glycosylase [Rhodomicrobium udaipurense]MBJ7542352.1 uracil-DNA glycosylase [Rhodomicrobium udaipurense]